MSQQRNKKRFGTLNKIGANFKTLVKSANNQINWFFGFIIVIAIFNSYFGIQSIFVGFQPGSTDLNIREKTYSSLIALAILIIVELIYMMIVKKNNRNFIRKLMNPEREE